MINGSVLWGIAGIDHGGTGSEILHAAERLVVISRWSERAACESARLPWWVAAKRGCVELPGLAWVLAGGGDSGQPRNGT